MATPKISFYFSTICGNWNSKTAPRGDTFLANNRPSRSFAIDELIANPKPTPSPGFFVVKNGSNISSRFSIPGPLSWIVKVYI
jgi:hypothetical protein